MTIGYIWGEDTVIGTALITEYLQTILLTGRVEKEAPVSTFIIAKPEHGKTSICLESPTSCAIDVTDCTGRALQEICKYKAEVTHIIINDLTMIQAHGKTVRAYLIGTINAMTEEGIRTVLFPGQTQTYENGAGKRGIIACCTPALMEDNRTWFNKIGLSTRIVPFRYSYSEKLVIRIKASICDDVESKPPEKFSIPTMQVNVEIEEKESREILQISTGKSEELGDETGIRRLKQFRRLAKGHALLRTWKNAKVNQTDIQFLKAIFPYISYKQGSIL